MSIVDCKMRRWQMPGERERIDHGLKHLSPLAVMKHLSLVAHSVDGLRQRATLFPESVMPKPSVIHCMRCDMDFDPKYCSKLSCKVEHPEARVRQRWDGSKKSWDECGRCGKTFNCDGMHGWIVALWGTRAHGVSKANTQQSRL